MKKVVFYIVFTAVVFATMEVALKIAGKGLDALQLTFLRFLIGGIVLAVPAVIESRHSGYRINGADAVWLAMVGIMGVSISMLAFQIGVMNCNASTAAPLICTNPLFTMLIAGLSGQEKMDRRKWLAFFIGLAAIIMMIRPWDVQEGNSVKGILIMLFSAVTFGAYSVMGKRSVGRIGVFTQTSISFVAGSLVLLIVMLATGHPVTEGVMENLPLVVYCGVIVTGLGYLTYFLAIKESDATTGSVTFFVKPAIAPVFAVVILHETILWNTIAGILLLITASGIILYDSMAGRKDG